MIKLVQDYVKKNLASKEAEKKLLEIWSSGNVGDFQDREPPSEALVKVGDKIYRVRGLRYEEIFIAPEVFE